MRISLDQLGKDHARANRNFEYGLAVQSPGNFQRAFPGAGFGQTGPNFIEPGDAVIQPAYFFLFDLRVRVFDGSFLQRMDELWISPGICGLFQHVCVLDQFFFGKWGAKQRDADRQAKNFAHR